nr:uncharacterized protein LOC115495088 [Taeniopygia guttata]
MAGQGGSWMLQVYLLALLVHPLDPSSRPERGTSGLLPKELELQDTANEAGPWGDLALLFWTCFLGDVLVAGVVLGCCCLGRRFWRRRRKEQCRDHSGRAGARCRCCRGRGCPTTLMQLLRQNRALLQLCLNHPPRRAPGRGRSAGAVGERRVRSHSAPSSIAARSSGACVTSGIPISRAGDTPASVPRFPTPLPKETDISFSVPLLEVQVF